MAYTMDSFYNDEEREEKSLVALIQDTARTSIVLGTLAELITSKVVKDQSDERAHRAVKSLVEKLSEQASEEEALSREGPVFKLLGRVMSVAGTKILEFIIRPVFKFAMEVAMGLVRFAVRAVVTWVIEPVIAGVLGFIVANPITAAIAISLIAGGAGYYIWKKFFKETAPEPKVPEGLEQQPVAAGRSVTTVSTSVAATPVTQPLGVSNYVTEPMPAPVSAGPFKGKLAKPSDSVRDAILTAAKTVGVDPGIMFAIAASESNFDPTASAQKFAPKGVTATAGGLFQFTDRTWRGMIDKYGGSKSGPGHGIMFGDKFKAVPNAIMGALFIRDNALTLSNKYHLPPSAANIYMAHFLGPDTAGHYISSMNRSPDTSAASLYPVQAKSNPHIFYDKKGNARSLREVYDLMTNSNAKVSNEKAAAYNLALGTTPGSTEIGADTPRLASGVTSAKTPAQATHEVASNTPAADTTNRSVNRELAMGTGKTVMEVQHG